MPVWTNSVPFGVYVYSTRLTIILCTIDVAEIGGVDKQMVSKSERAHLGQRSGAEAQRLDTKGCLLPAKHEAVAVAGDLFPQLRSKSDHTPYYYYLASTSSLGLFYLSTAYHSVP